MGSNASAKRTAIDGDASTRQPAGPSRLSAAQDLRQRFALCEFVDELVQPADLLHQRILNRLHPHTARLPGDLLGLRVERGRCKELLERAAKLEMLPQRRSVRPAQPRGPRH